MVVAITLGRNRDIAALRALRKLNISVCGPFVTRTDRCLYVVDGCVVARSELLALYEDGKLTSKKSEAILSDMKRLQTAPR